QWAAAIGEGADQERQEFFAPPGLGRGEELLELVDEQQHRTAALAELVGQRLRSLAQRLLDRRLAAGRRLSVLEAEQGMRQLLDRVRARTQVEKAPVALAQLAHQSRDETGARQRRLAAPARPLDLQPPDAAMA